MLLPPYAYNCAPPQNPAARSSGLPWYGAVILAVGVLVLILGALALAWHRLGPQMAAYRALAAKKLPPGKGSLGKAITLVLTDVEGSTELWEWDTELMSQAVDMHDRWGEGGGVLPHLHTSASPVFTFLSVEQRSFTLLDQSLTLWRLPPRVMRECMSKHFGYEVMTEGDAFLIRYVWANTHGEPFRHFVLSFP